MLSMKTRYAMVAMIKLAREYGRGAIAISEIADSEQIPRRFLEGILLKLKNVGLVDSVRGKMGGYRLAKELTEIRLSTIITTFEGSVGMLACVCPQCYRPCEFHKNEEACKLRRTFKYIHQSTFGILENTTLQDLI
jgi:Rrf2 family protein